VRGYKVKVRIRRRDEVVEIVTLIDTGYEANSPQLKPSTPVAKALGPRLPPPEARERVL